MAALTHAQLVTQVEEMTGRTDKTSEIGTYVNWAQIAVARIHTFSYMRMESTASTVASVETYTFPTNIKSFHSLRVQTAGKERKLLNKIAMVKDSTVPFPSNESEGTPVYYTPWGRNFELEPVPDAVVTLSLRWETWPADMATGDTSNLKFMDDVLCNYASWWVSLAANLEKDIRRFKAEFKDGLSQVIKVDTIDTGGEEDIRAEPYVGGNLILEPGETNEYWKKASFLRSPM